MRGPRSCRHPLGAHRHRLHNGKTRNVNFPECEFPRSGGTPWEQADLGGEPVARVGLHAPRPVRHSGGNLYSLPGWPAELQSLVAPRPAVTRAQSRGVLGRRLRERGEHELGDGARSSREEGSVRCPALPVGRGWGARVLWDEWPFWRRQPCVICELPHRRGHLSRGGSQQ